MTHITQLTEIVEGRLLPSGKKLSATLLDVSTGRLTTEGNTLGFDDTDLATETFVTNAIANAQIGGGEVDLSGYATKDDLTSKVDKIEGKGLSTNDFTNDHKTAVDNIETTVSTAVAALIDGAPTTFDTLREIAEWIETDGVTATELASSIATKADKTATDELILRVDALESAPGADLTNYPTKTEVESSIETYITEVYDPAISSYVSDQLDEKLNVPEQVDVLSQTPNLVNSVPLYTLDNGGNYVLCTPDTWLNINGFYVPGYSPETFVEIV